MAMEELDEFEVLWPDACHAYAHEPPPAPASTPISSPLRVKPRESPASRPKQRGSARSRPVDVPGAARLHRWKDGDDQESKGGDGGEKIVPPHLLASGRRRSEGESAAASTLRSGRPCKRAGDLHHLRDSVLRMTGFIEG